MPRCVLERLAVAGVLRLVRAAGAGAVALPPTLGGPRVKRRENLGSPAATYLASLSTGSRRTMRRAAEILAEELGEPVDAARGDGPVAWHSVTYGRTQAAWARIVARYAPATANKILAALRGVLKQAVRLGQMTTEACERACDLRAAKGSREPRGRALAPEEITALLEASDRGTTAGARDAALVAVLYGCGLRRAEAVALDLADYDELERVVLVRGKGNKERRVPVEAPAPFIATWIERRGRGGGPLFVPIGRTGRMAPRRLTDQAVYTILRRIAGVAGVAEFSPHDVRRTFVSDLLDQGADISVVQQLAGHAQVTTTQRYDRRGEDARRRAAGLLQLETT